MNKNILFVALIFGAIAMVSIKRWSIPERGRKFASLFQSAEYEYNIPRLLLAKQAEQESNYDPNAKSSAGAIGIMQIVPKWHPNTDPTNPIVAIPYAASYMRLLYNRFKSWRMALAAYNAGPTALQRRIDAYGDDWLANMPKETRNYVQRITKDVYVT